MVRTITAGDPETSDLLRYMYVAHMEPERIDREMALSGSSLDFETWECQNQYSDAWHHYENQRRSGFTGPGDG
jgi:hypothetical protein